MQLQAHLLGNIHEQVVEHLQQYRVHRGSCCKFDSALRNADKGQVVKLCQSGLPARLHHGGGILLGNDGRAVNHVTRTQCFTHHQCRLHPLTIAVHTHHLGYRTALKQVTRSMHGVARLDRGIAGNDRLHRHRLNDQPLAVHQEREALAIGRFKPCFDLRHNVPRRQFDACRVRNHQRRITSLIANMDAQMRRDLTLVDLLLSQFRFGHLGQCIELSTDLNDGLWLQLDLHRLFANNRLVCQPHAVGRQHPGQRMHKHPRHAQRIGHQAGVLTTGTTKALQGVTGHIVATGD